MRNFFETRIAPRIQSCRSRHNCTMLLQLLEQPSLSTVELLGVDLLQPRSPKDTKTTSPQSLWQPPQTQHFRERASMKICSGPHMTNCLQIWLEILLRLLAFSLVGLNTYLRKLHRLPFARFAETSPVCKLTASTPRTLYPSLTLFWIICHGCSYHRCRCDL